MSSKPMEIHALKLLAELMRLKLILLDKKASGDINDAGGDLDGEVRFVADDLLGDVATLKEIISLLE